jgi:hypothetical protein
VTDSYVSYFSAMSDDVLERVKREVELRDYISERESTQCLVRGRVANALSSQTGS